MQSTMLGNNQFLAKAFIKQSVLGCSWCLYIYIHTHIYEILYIYIYIYKHTHIYERGYPRGLMVKVMDCGIISEFEFDSRYYVHFQTNTLGKGTNPLILPSMG